MLSARQQLALSVIAAEPTIEGAADKIGVTRKTLYEWFKQEAFKLAVDQARREHVESAFRTMRLAAKRRIFASNIRRIRLQRGWSQEALAARAGIHRTYMGSAERGERNVAIDNVCRIAWALGVPAFELLRE
jgi:DNA-binding XRE family transcriptional regulator